MQCNCLKYNYLIFRTPHKSYSAVVAPAKIVILLLAIVICGSVERTKVCVVLSLNVMINDFSSAFAIMLQNTANSESNNFLIS